MWDGCAVAAVEGDCFWEGVRVVSSEVGPAAALVPVLEGAESCAGVCEVLLGVSLGVGAVLLLVMVVVVVLLRLCGGC